MEENSRMELRITLKFLLPIAMWATVSAAGSCRVEAQLLSQARDEIFSSAPSPSGSENRDRKRQSRDDDSDNDDGNNFIGNLFTAIFFGNGNSNHRKSSYLDSGDNDIDYEIYSSSDSIRAFVDYPYEDGVVGGILIDEMDMSRGRIQSAAWYGSDFDNIDTWNSQIRFDNPGRLGLDFQYSHLTEKLSGLPRDSLNLADVNLTYRWIEGPHLISRIGGGVNFFWDRNATEADLNFTMSADFFPKRPWIASLEFDYGELGSTHQTHFLSTLGFNYRDWELMTGYEYRRIGRVDIDGAIFGFRVWW